MPVIVKNHVHLGDAADFVIDLQAKKPVFGEIVPMTETSGFFILVVELLGRVPESYRRFLVMA